GAAEDLPAGIDASAYRVIQEALTNTLKHARATTAEVALAVHPEELTIDILDDGHPAGPPADGGPHPGRGIIGMRERAALYAGAPRRRRPPPGPGERGPPRARPPLRRPPAPRAAPPGRIPGPRPLPPPPARTTAMTTRVLICDDQSLVRSGFRMIIEARAGLE